MFDYLVVGGGVIGLSLAWELGRRKATVCVVDRQHIGRATSWVGAGIFPPPKTGATHDPLERLRGTSHRLHREWADRLRQDVGVDNGLRRSGGIYFARRAGEAAVLKVEMTQAADDGVECIRLTNQELIAQEPRLRSIADQVKAAYFLPDEMQLRSPHHLQALAKACKQVGVQLRSDTDALELLVQSDCVVGLRTNRETITSKNYCICGGPWAASLLKPLGICLPIEPWRGQLLLWKTQEPLVSHVVNEGFRYLVPRDDGHLLVGATVEDVGFDAGTTDAAEAELTAYSLELLPALSDYRPVATWAGLRPKTPDGLPTMGKIPGMANLSVSGGHYRSGLHISPASAVFMADLLLDDGPPPESNPFRLHR